MATITVRNGLGRPLTAQEMDDNLVGLNNELVTTGSMTTEREITLVTRDASVADVTVDTTPMYDSVVDEATALAIALG